MKKQNRIGISILLLAVLALSLALPVFSALAAPPEGGPTPDPTSAGASKSLGTDSIGKSIAGDSITLNGIMNDDILPPYYEENTIYESGFPWSKEDVSWTITKWGEIPGMKIGVEHINYTYPIGGWIMEVKFVNSDLSWEGMNPMHFNPDQSHNFTRYVWATYSRQTTTRGGWRSGPGGTDKWGNALNTHQDVYEEYSTKWNEANRVAHGEGSWAGSIQVDDFRLLVNNSRVAVVKTDMSFGFNLTDGVVVGPGYANPADRRALVTLNLTYVFFKDKKYIVEYKNINCHLPKGYADYLEIQFMQTKQLDTDLGGYNEDPLNPIARKTDARMYWDAPNYTGLTYPFGCDYWGNFSIAISELDEQYVADIPSPDIAHTTYMAFYPRLSNWALRQWRLVNDPTPITNSTAGYTWTGASHKWRENCSDNDYNLIVGAWNFTMETEDQFHLTGVEGAAEWQWDYTEEDWCPTDALPGMDGNAEPTAPHNSNFEISWALNETFRPLFQLNDIGRYSWWPFQESGTNSPGPNPTDVWTGVYDYCDHPVPNWPWWDGRRVNAWNTYNRQNTAMYIVGETTTIDPYKHRTASTHDTLAAIDIAQSTNSTGWNNCPPPYRSALDTAASYFAKDRINLYRWHYYYYSGDGHWYEKPVKICSMVNETWDPTTSPWWDNNRDKYNVWHIITTGGPDVNAVTNYFNDFGFVYYLGAWPTPSDLMPVREADAKTPDVLYVPASKNVYYDYKDDAGACHYFSRISLVHDHNITREYWETTGTLNMQDETHPWAALVVDGLMAEGTQMAGSFVAHTWDDWAMWDVRETWNHGAVALVLEFIDYEQDGCIDETIVVEVVGTVTTSLVELPDVDYKMTTP